MKSEKERLIEDLDILYDDIEYLNERLRQYEHYGIPLPEDYDEDSIEQHINSMQNEASYIEACLEDD